MNYTDFSELTQFVHDEHQKIVNTYGPQTVPTKELLVIFRGVSKKFKLYEKLDVWKDKRNIKVEKALFTMPHGWLWKMFHSKTWYYVKQRLEEKNAQPQPDEPPKEETPVAVPQVVAPVDLDALSRLSALQKGEE